MENSQGHGKSWKMMMMSWIFLWNCTRIFVSVNIILFVVSLVLLTDWLTSNWKYIFILVSIHKLCIIYFEKICCADRSWKFIFWWWKSHGKSLLKKSCHPVLCILVGWMLPFRGREALPGTSWILGDQAVFSNLSYILPSDMSSGLHVRVNTMSHISKVLTYATSCLHSCRLWYGHICAEKGR